MNLTINENLMNDTKDANVCLFIANLATWIRTNAKKDDPRHRNLHEGRCWSYNSIQEFVKYFGFWSTKNIRTIIANCIKLDLIVTSNFNKKKFDNTLWYSLTDRALEYYPQIRDLVRASLADSGKRLAETGNAIPEILTTGSNNTITTTSSEEAPLTKKQETTAFMLAMIAVYRGVFPDNPQPHPKLISTTLQKTLQSLIRRWPEADPAGNALDIETFERYLIGLKTLAPKFSLGEYFTKEGNKRKNGMETFCRWNTLVQFLENKYS